MKDFGGEGLEGRQRKNKGQHHRMRNGEEKTGDNRYEKLNE